jgi:hypothetical protein
MIEREELQDSANSPQLFAQIGILVDPAIIQNDIKAWDGVGSIVSNKLVHGFRE